ncbi:Pentatricopeptide repeat [Macleaya cordata]|uniref:Pentatricopeptide repeat n=1 Tax=Macleaya cordata TaxID=56857 RepID=A0A200R900_MACCD|nr:Pentatricopeptide repeat [Macleaya cordata]
MVLFSSFSLSNTGGNLSRRRRKWPLLPFKAKWQENFNEEQAMKTLKKAAAEPQTQNNSSEEKTNNLLSVLVNSFNIYSCDPTPSAYSFIIKTLTLNSQFDQLPPVLDRLEKIEKFGPPERMFINLIRIYGDANKLQDAIDLFFRIPNFRCTPSIYSLNALLSVLCKTKEGLQMVHQVLLKTQSMNIRLEESSFRILIIALCKLKKIGYAIELLNMMSHYGCDPDSELYSEILSAICENNDLSSVLSFLEVIRKVGFVPNGEDYTNVIRILVKDGRGKDALGMLNKMKSDGMKPDVVCYTRVLDGIISAGDFHKAEKLFDEMLVLGVVPNIYTYNVYLNGLCKQNKIEEGFKMLGCMEELGCKPDVVTYNTLVGAVCKVGEVKRGREVLRKMGMKGIEGNVHTYRILIDGLISNGEVVEACGLLEEMLGKDLIPRSSTFDEMISELCKQGLVSEALQLLEQMVETSVAPGARAWEVLLSKSELGSNEATRTYLEDLIATSKLSNQIAIWGTKFETGYGVMTKLPFLTALTTIIFLKKGISKILVVNKFDDCLLPVASCKIHRWQYKMFIRGKTTAFQGQQCVLLSSRDRCVGYKVIEICCLRLASTAILSSSAQLFIPCLVIMGSGGGAFCGSGGGSAFFEGGVGGRCCCSGKFQWSSSH